MYELNLKVRLPTEKPSVFKEDHKLAPIELYNYTSIMSLHIGWKDSLLKESPSGLCLCFLGKGTYRKEASRIVKDLTSHGSTAGPMPYSWRQLAKSMYVFTRSERPHLLWNTLMEPCLSIIIKRHGPYHSWRIKKDLIIDARNLGPMS